jgi:peptidoglycan/LPS O-acetylase OafA/YrhL
MGKKSRRVHSAGSRDKVHGARRAEPPVSIAQDDRYPSLSGLRGLAALGVFAVHAYALARFPQIVPEHPAISFVLAWPLRMGWAGVNVFFTLSAFLLSLPFAKASLAAAPSPSLRGYAARRVLRILPAYAVQLLVLFALIALGWASGVVSPPYSVARMLVQPVFLYDIGWPGVVSVQQPLVASWWTLPVEMSFYALLPWFARFLRQGRWHWLLIGVAFAWFWRAWLLWTQPPKSEILLLVQHLPGCLDQFLIGMLAAYACVRAPDLLRSITGRRLDAAFAAATVVFLLLPALGYLAFGEMMDADPHPQPSMIGWNGYASLAVAAMLIVCARGSCLADRLLSMPPLRGLGRISYGFYLWHLPVLLWLRANGGVDAAGGALAFALYGLLFSLVIAGISWVIVERPALRFASSWPAADQAKIPDPVSVHAS